MRFATTFLPRTILVLVLAGLAACYGSVTLEGEDATDDATDGSADDATDGATDDADGAREDDAATDDGVDVEPDVPPAPYVLHEWGVMLLDGEGGGSMHGPSPDFSGAIPAKPVLYLYADEPIAPLSIAVDFASGGSTDVWPEIPLGPRVEWNDLALRPGPCTITAFPNPWDDDRWEETMCEACDLESCVVPGAACLDFTNPAGETTISDLLFYTGTLPDYRGPLAAEARVINEPGFADRLEVTITNRTPRAVEDVWFVYRQATDSCIDPSACSVVSADLAWVHFDEVAGGASFDEPLDIVRVEAAVDETGFPVEPLTLPAEWLALGDDLTARLVERGLTAGEAAAFMRNWDTIFFGLLGSDSVWSEPFYRNGAALIYFMSPEDYDAQLPLRASPPPVETVRVGMIYENLP
ncbi:MAG: hypothetical protein JXB32_00405 [Deltaproteobacteria bacterium]|nr:hypothetical protein [Deltaproteobacteria bacterium]